ncbi:MAG: hypothetical protein K9H64_06305 [Bacteroidales bacterium]|nr:hypothetical protein [Bacteroidales bacterium]MCF8455308.1 hypothetical protein [Bacteroidales bacterium]
MKIYNRFFALSLILMVLVSCTEKNPAAFRSFTSTEHRLIGEWKLVKLSGNHAEFYEGEINTALYVFDKKTSDNLYIYFENGSGYFEDFTLRYTFYIDKTSHLEILSPNVIIKDDEWDWLDNTEKDLIYIQSLDFFFGYRNFKIKELTTTSLTLEMEGKTESLDNESDYELKVHFEYTFEKMD